MIRGKISLPGDKSISHRAALFSSLKYGKSVFTNFNSNHDCTATLACLAKMGIRYNLRGTKLTIYGQNFEEWNAPESDLNAQNSGTTARLISGLLAAQRFKTKLTGDESLKKRPMERVISPLRLMGADIHSDNGLLPITFNPVAELNAIQYELPVASAQVKSAILLAGLFSQGITQVIERTTTRDHTERMLKLDKTTHDNFNIVSSSRKNNIPDLSMHIPGDFSSAAFYIAATLILPNSQLKICDVSLNPTRIGLLSVLKKMGANIKVSEKKASPEPIGDLDIESSTLNNQPVPAEIIPNIIDEIPILAILASQSEGEFIIKNAKELRYKESDRIKTVVENLKNIGVKANEFDDGFSLKGPQKISGGKVTTYGDHRIAMAFTIAGLIAENSVKIDNLQCASVSFPGFYTNLKKIIV